MKWIKLIGLILLLPLALLVLVILLGFILGLSPALTIGFVAWQIVGIFKERNENKMKLEYKLKTNKDFLTFQYKSSKGKKDIENGEFQ